MSSKLENVFVSKYISKLYQDSRTADVRFLFKINNETEEVPAHKSILAIASSVFDAMFFGSLKEDEVVEIVDVSAGAFKEFLQFFYLPEVTLSMENIGAVVRLADKYDILDHVIASAELLVDQLIGSKIIWGYQLTIALNIPELKEFCEVQIKTLPSDAYKTDDFLRCDKVVIENILQLESMSIGEVDLFKACVEWAKMSCRDDGSDEDDPRNLKSQLGDCLYMIRYATMKIEDIGLIMTNEQFKGLFSRDEIADLMCMKTVANYESKLFKQTKRNKYLKCCITTINSYCTAMPVRQRESTWLSTNRPVLLCEIVCSMDLAIHSLVHFDISLLEYDDCHAESLFVYFLPKITYETTVLFERGPERLTISLPQPILFQPNKLYEIRSVAMGDVSNVYHSSNSSIWEREVKLDEEVTIKIFLDPQDRNSSCRGKPIDSLHFQRI